MEEFPEPGQAVDMGFDKGSGCQTEAGHHQ